MYADIKRISTGFTMVEMMLVVLLLGIVAAVAVPSINRSLDGIKLDGAAREIVHAIQYTQSLSIKEGTVHGVQFFIDANQFRCYEIGPGNVVLHPIDKKPYEVDFNGTGYYQGLEVISTTLSGNKVQFNALGELLAGGSIILGIAGFQRTINVTAPAGKITVN